MNLVELATYPPHARTGACFLLSSPSRFGRQGYLPLMHVARRYVTPAGEAQKPLMMSAVVKQYARAQLSEREPCRWREL